MKKNQGVWYFY